MTFMVAPVAEYSFSPGPITTINFTWEVIPSTALEFNISDTDTSPRTYSLGPYNHIIIGNTTTSTLSLSFAEGGVMTAVEILASEVYEYYPTSLQNSYNFSWSAVVQPITTLTVNINETVTSPLVFSQGPYDQIFINNALNYEINVSVTINGIEMITQIPENEGTNFQSNSNQQSYSFTWSQVQTQPSGAL
jgi:hypothetical protein